MTGIDGFGPFHHAFQPDAQGGTGYGSVLRIGDWSDEIIERIVAALHHRDAHRYVVSFLGQDNWRYQVVAAIAVLLAPRPAYPRLIWRLVDRASWATPQLVVTALLVDPLFARRAAARVSAGCPTRDPYVNDSRPTPYAEFTSGKMLASILGVASEHDDLRPRVAGWRADPRLAALLTADVSHDNSEEIASNWLRGVRERFARRNLSLRPARPPGGPVSRWLVSLRQWAAAWPVERALPEGEDLRELEAVLAESGSADAPRVPFVPQRPTRLTEADRIRDRATATLTDRYDIGEELGIGATTVAFRAHDKLLDRDVVLKVLRYSDHENAVFRFLRNIELTRQLSHPAVEVPLAFDQHEGLAYYTVPFVEGVSLAEMIGRSGRIEWPEAYRIVARAADGLAHAHEKRLVHRTLHPGKIRVAGSEVIVSGFGVLSPDPTSDAEEQFVGNPSYLAPEGMLGKVVDHRADIFGLGAILYEMLTGESPATGATIAEVFVNRLTGSPPRPSDARADLPAHADVIVMKAMATEPADRYQTGHELATVLRSSRS